MSVHRTPPQGSLRATANRPSSSAPTPSFSAAATDLDDVRRSPSLGVFGVGARLVTATASEGDEIRLDLIGPGGHVAAPLAVATTPASERGRGSSAQGSVERVLFVDNAQRDWADDPSIVWHLRRRVEERCAVERRALDCPDADQAEWSHPSGRSHPLGVIVTRAHTITVSCGDSGVVWLDRLSATGSVDAPVGVVTGVDTAIPRLFLDVTARAWAGEPPMAWHLTRQAIDRFWSTSIDAATVGGPSAAASGAEPDGSIGSVGSLIIDRCRPRDVDVEYDRWHGPGPHQRSAAHPTEPVVPDGGERG